MADLVAETEGEGKSIVLIAYTPDESASDQSAGPVEQAFKQEAAERFTLVKTLHLNAPKRLVGSMQTERVTAKLLRKELAGVENVDAIVSLCGEPMGTLAELKSFPPFYCLCDQGERIPALMEAEIVRAAYVPRRSNPAGESNQEMFNLLYELALPETVDALYSN